MKYLHLFRRLLIAILFFLPTFWVTSCATSGHIEIADGTLDSAYKRQGLATRWGATKDSRIDLTTFKRNSGSMQTSLIYYNDKDGAEAMKRSPVRWFNKSLHLHHDPDRDVIVGLEDTDGHPIPWTWADEKRVYVAKKGYPYVIAVHNKTHGRIEAVVSVDGLDVVDGQPASTVRRGYIINGKETLRIEGFRRSRNEIARFEFSSVGDSYANKTGGESAARNVGVIGVASFREHDEETLQRENAEAFPYGFAQPPSR